VVPRDGVKIDCLLFSAKRITILQDRYLIDVSFRADGSSKFPDHKWGYFPAVGAAWRVKQESFLKHVEAVNDLKVRASYGILGNQNGIGDFAAKGLWTAVHRIQRQCRYSTVAVGE
jgi:hypothetical protein